MTTCVTNTRRRPDGFTLIELLTVIAVIMILIALLVPAAGILRQSTKRKAAATRAQSICQAVKHYRQVYGKFPGQTQGIDDQVVEEADILNALVDNPRNEMFIEVSPKEINEDGELVDPWQMAYMISMDENSDGNTEMDETLDGGNIDTNVVGHNVVVSSWGGHPENEASRVYSWTDKTD